MTDEYDPTTGNGLSAYLTSQKINHSSVQLLTGGTANYVYRVTLPSGSTTIYKHAAPYLHSNTAFSFDPARMDYENRILEILPPLFHAQLPDSNVHAVSVHSYDRARKLLCLSDGGPRHLKDAYTDPTLNIPKIGAELGKWLAALHTSTPATPLSLTPTDTSLKANNPIGVSIYRYAYQNLHLAFAQYLPDDVALAHEVNEVYGSRLTHENECLCHGDFWPGNVLLKNPSTSSSSTPTSVDLTVVDWEMSRRGTSATDAAQFCAEAFLLDRFRGARGLLPAFLNAYLAVRGGKALGREWFARIAVHWGVHVGFWPTRVEWTDGEGTRELVEMGAQVLRAVIEGKWGVLFAGELFRGVDTRFMDFEG
ncbi:kinase-like protein [Bimuria novae-zelandiae CBS 107.79]|uniref:Kinase-like protein n=1 Tax=Bimuria novae-zelandiae CBS 107.79 TaxID=1447943 RepID=A0A6A5V3P6_9PLEO|nr:kinase-like protein [Bimuria novae-zelandiae CBS 107.79]